jgi:hypothetical protein
MSKLNTETQLPLTIVSGSIFEHIFPFSFAWSQGRLLIMNNKQELVDFSDGGLSRGGRGGYAEFEHSVLGNIKAENTKFVFKDYNVEFDFNSLKNCGFLEKNKIKDKPKYTPPVIYHLERYSKKRSS